MLLAFECSPMALPVAAFLPSNPVLKICMQMVLPVAGPVFPRWRLWLCGSDRDNRRYGNVYDLTNVDRCV